MTRTTKIILATIAALVLVASAVTIKMVWFPGVSDALFEQMSGQKLKQAPSGLVMVRPTHFPQSPTNGMTVTGVRGKRWMMGRNVTFQQLIATAYDYNPGRTFVPPSAPKNNFDFIVTALSGPTEHLRGAIQKKTGYIASVETRDADVLAIVVKDRTLPGMTVSAADEKKNEQMKGGRLYLKHQKIDDIVKPLTQVLKTPVIDKTGLADYYDFSLEWNNKIQSGDLNQDDIQNILHEWGLGLEPDTASIEMLVAKKAN